MDDSNLDKLFSDQLGEEQEFDFREEDWLEVADRLQDKPRRRWGWLWIAAGLFMALSVGVNTWQAFNLHEVQEEISVLEKRINDQESKKNNSSSANNASSTEADASTSTATTNTTTTNTSATNTTKEKQGQNANTAVSKDTVYQTIYKTIIKEKEVPVYVYPQNQEDEKLNAKGINLPIVDLEQENAVTTTEQIELLTSAPIQLLPIAERDLSPNERLVDLDLLAEKSPIIEEGFKKKVYLGPSLSAARIPIKDCVNQLNAGIGIDLDFQLSKHWSLEASYSYNQINSTCVTTVDSLNVFIDVESPNDLYFESVALSNPNPPQNYTRDYIENVHTNQSYNQLSLGGQYRFGPEIFIGGHVLAYHNLKRNDTYNYPIENGVRNSLRPFITNDEDLVNADGYFNGYIADNKSSIVIDRLEITAGKEFNLGKKWRMPVELFYQQNLNKSENSLPPLLGVRTAFMLKI